MGADFSFDLYQPRFFDKPPIEVATGGSDFLAATRPNPQSTHGNALPGGQRGAQISPATRSRRNKGIFLAGERFTQNLRDVSARLHLHRCGILCVVLDGSRRRRSSGCVFLYRPHFFELDVLPLSSTQALIRGPYVELWAEPDVIDRHLPVVRISDCISLKTRGDRASIGKKILRPHLRG